MSCVLCTEQVKVFSTLASGQDLVAVLKRVGRLVCPLPLAKMLVVPISFFSGG